MNNPNSQEPYGLDLPPLNPENIDLDVPVNPETGLGRLNNERPQVAELPQAAVPDPAIALGSISSASAVSTPPLPSDSLPIEGPKTESDLIAKEWVVKAKEIAVRTRHDPHLQNQEFIRFKADFMRTRYNKDLVTDEK